MFKENPYYLATLTLKNWFGKILACVAWRFCRAGRRSGVAAKFAREARENERRSREKNKNRLPGFVAFSTAAPFNSFWHPVDNLFGFSFPNQSEIKCWQPKHDTKAREKKNVKRDLGRNWSLLEQTRSRIGDYTAF